MRRRNRQNQPTPMMVQITACFVVGRNRSRVGHKFRSALFSLGPLMDSTRVVVDRIGCWNWRNIYVCPRILSVFFGTGHVQDDKKPYTMLACAVGKGNGLFVAPICKDTNGDGGVCSCCD